jgi:hypothetical protein
LKRNHLSTAATIALLAFSVLGITPGDAVSTTLTVVPPPTNPQTTNATLEYDLTNRLTENGTTCTYGWGPMFTFYRTPDEFSFNFSSTSPIDVYVFSSYHYNGTLSCTFGPYAPHMPDNKPALTGERGEFGSTCMGCTSGSSDYILFINRDATATPHVTLEVAVKLHATTTTTVVTPPPSAIPFIGVPEVLFGILLGLFVVVRRRSRGDKK